MIRVLLLADTHLGYDMPRRPRIERRRRGPEFFACTRHALEVGRRGVVDLVVHGGDLLYRSRVSRSLVAEALEPLLEVADGGVPVLLVPGNHERSALPYPLLAAHRDFHVFDRPRTISVVIRGLRVALAGFPCERDGARNRFTDLVAATGVRDVEAHVRLLCLHQIIEGARVGLTGYTFRHGPDVIRGSDVPGDFAAVLAGHIHRHQVLRRDLSGRTLAAPVLYPGSVERTSFAERDEAKGYLVLELEPDQSGGRVVAATFHELPGRPMVVCRVAVDGLGPGRLQDELRRALGALPDDAIVQLRLAGHFRPGSEAVLRAARLRDLHPATMNVQICLDASTRQ